MKEQLEIVIALLENPNFPGYTIMMPIDAIREGLLGWATAAINDRLEEVAIELDKLSEGHYTSAQTPAGLVRAMKEG